MDKQETQPSEDWRDNVSDSAGATLKVLDGETKQVVFLDQGIKKTSADYGTSIVFKVEHEVEEEDEETKEKTKVLKEMNFYVKENNFSLLRQIKELGDLSGKLVKISRVGSKKSDTRYTIEEVDVKEVKADSKELP